MTLSLLDTNDAGTSTRTSIPLSATGLASGDELIVVHQVNGDLTGAGISDDQAGSWATIDSAVGGTNRAVIGYRRTVGAGESLLTITLSQANVIGQGCVYKVEGFSAINVSAAGTEGFATAVGLAATTVGSPGVSHMIGATTLAGSSGGGWSYSNSYVIGFTGGSPVAARRSGEIAGAITRSRENAYSRFRPESGRNERPAAVR